jgi:hypothetical protein
MRFNALLTYCVPCPSRSPWSDHPNRVRWWVQVVSWCRPRRSVQARDQGCAYMPSVSTRLLHNMFPGQTRVPPQLPASSQSELICKWRGNDCQLNAVNVLWQVLHVGSQQAPSPRTSQAILKPSCCEAMAFPNSSRPSLVILVTPESVLLLFSCVFWTPLLFCQEPHLVLYGRRSVLSTAGKISHRDILCTVAHGRTFLSLRRMGNMFGRVLWKLSQQQAVES